jgi:hypothetical protein
MTMISQIRKAQQLYLNHAPKGAAIMVLILFAFISGPVAAFETSYFKAPSLDGYTLLSEEDADGDGDGAKETHVKHYSNATGDLMFSMTTKGTLWAWSRQSHAGAESDKNYVLRDSDCDGVFDQRYSLDEEYHVPDCLK